MNWLDETITYGDLILMFLSYLLASGVGSIIDDVYRGYKRKRNE